MKLWNNLLFEQHHDVAGGKTTKMRHNKHKRNPKHFSSLLLLLMLIGQ